MATTLLGTGVFILPQLTIGTAGHLALWTWALLTVAMLPLAWVFAELGRRFPSAAGPAFFVQTAFGQRSGYVIGLMFLCVVPLGAPAALMLTFEFFKPLINLSPNQALFGQLAAFVLLFVANWWGLQLSGRVQLALIIAIVAVVVLLLVAFAVEPIQADPTISAGTSAGMLSAMGLAIWSFLGIEAITHLSAEFRDPKRDFVPAVLVGTVLVGLIYLACTYLSMIAPHAPLAIVGTYEQLLGSSGRWVIAILGIASGLATVNVYFASVSRLAWSLSQQGVLPSFMQKLNRHQVPSRALLVILLLCSVILVLAHFSHQHFDLMVRWVNGVFVLIYLASMLAAWRLIAATYRPAILLSLGVCLGFVVSLGTSMLYGLALALVFLLWMKVRRF